MITYTTNKFNTVCEKITEILKNNNININDSEEILPNSIISECKLYVSSLIIPADKFLSVPCPKCGKVHLEPFSRTYQRNIIFLAKNILVKFKITLPRVKCSNCNSTHVLLPDFCIPLKQYSKQAVLSIAMDASATSDEDIANKLNIDSKQVRRFVHILKSSQNNILLLYHKYSADFKIQLDDRSSIKDIIVAIPENFTELFFKEFRTIFLYIKTKRELYMQYHRLSI